MKNPGPAPVGQSSEDSLSHLTEYTPVTAHKNRSFDLLILLSNQMFVHLQGYAAGKNL